MDCGASIVKYLLFAFNLVCSLAGLLLIIMGALVQAKMSNIADELDKGDFGVPAIIAIVVGSIVFILAFLGCCGAARESHSMLISYSVLLCCVFVVEVAIAVLAFVYRTKFVNVVEDEMQTWYAEYDSSSDAKKIVNDVQGLFECCGLQGPLDFKSPILPESCCSPDTKINCTVITPGVYKTGCLSAVTDFGSWAGNVVGWVAIGICAVEILGIVFACCLASSIKNESRRGRYA